MGAKGVKYHWKCALTERKYLNSWCGETQYFCLPWMVVFLSVSITCYCTHCSQFYNSCQLAAANIYYQDCSHSLLTQTKTTLLNGRICVTLKTIIGKQYMVNKRYSTLTPTESWHYFSHSTDEWHSRVMWTLLKKLKMVLNHGHTSLKRLEENVLVVWVEAISNIMYSLWTTF